MPPSKQQMEYMPKHPMVLLKLGLLLGLLLNVIARPSAVTATEDVANVTPCELESIISQLANPSRQYQMHVSSLRNQLRNILRERQSSESGEQTANNDLDYPDLDKRSLAALAAQGLLRANNAAAAKRSLATLAKNGQLPTPEPEVEEDDEQHSEDKRYVGSLARSGQMLGYGKRNVGTLARDYQLPQNGKRNLATMARLGLLARNEPKRNMAAVARYNSQRMHNSAAEKRNIGALKGSPVHGVQQKRGEDVYYPAGLDYVDPLAYYWNYGTYADMDWGDFGRAHKRFLDTSKDPELFGIENSQLLQNYAEEPEREFALDGQEEFASEREGELDDTAIESPAKRHIGAVYRSGFLPSYRALRSSMGAAGGAAVGGGRFSRSGRARQFV